jgi:hypothetical protein
MSGEKLTKAQRETLERVIAHGSLVIPEVSEDTRYLLIDLAMMTPPLVEAIGDVVIATKAGRAALASKGRE